MEGNCTQPHGAVASSNSFCAPSLPFAPAAGAVIPPFFPHPGIQGHSCLIRSWSHSFTVLPLQSQCDKLLVETSHFSLLISFPPMRNSPLFIQGYSHQSCVTAAGWLARHMQATINISHTPFQFISPSYLPLQVYRRKSRQAKPQSACHTTVSSIM